MSNKLKMEEIEVGRQAGVGFVSQTATSELPLPVAAAMALFRPRTWPS